MSDWDLIENMLLGEDDLEREELERSIPNDGPMVRAFYGLDKSTKERLIDALKLLPVAFGFVLTSPFWILYVFYEEKILPLYWHIESIITYISSGYDYQAEENRRKNIKEREKSDYAFKKRRQRERIRNIIDVIIMLVLLVIIIFLYSLMKKCNY